MHVDAMHIVMAATFVVILALVGQIVFRTHRDPELTDDHENRKRVTW